MAALSHELRQDTGDSGHILLMMKYLTITLFLGLFLALTGLVQAEQSELTADETISIPKVEFDARGDLKITASPTSSNRDFDFLVGRWKMHNRHLNKRLENCQEWTEFEVRFRPAEKFSVNGGRSA